MDGDHYPRLVIDNSSRPLPQQRGRHRQAPRLAFTKDPVVQSLRQQPIAPPIADRAHAHVKQPRRGRRAAKRVNHSVNGVEGDIAHARQYSSEMNAVNARFSDSMVGRQFSTIAGVLRDIPTDALTMTSWRLQAARRALNLSQRAACRAVTVEPNTWNQWERGKYMPDVLAMGRFGDLYGVTLDWIYRGRADTMAGSLAEKCTSALAEVIADEAAKAAS